MEFYIVCFDVIHDFRVACGDQKFVCNWLWSIVASCKIDIVFKTVYHLIFTGVINNTTDINIQWSVPFVLLVRRHQVGHQVINHH